MSKCKPLLFPFIVTDELSFVIEISYNTIRFYANHGVLVKDEEVYSIPSPYNYKDLWYENGIARIKSCQNGDVMYLFCDKYPIKKLIRKSNTDWEIQEIDFSAPWGKVNTDETVIIKTNETVGSIELTCEQGIFSKDNVGQYIRLTEVNSDTPHWVSGVSYSVGNIVKSDGKQYRATTNGTSGSVKPVHTKGVVTDKANEDGVSWQYISSGYGTIKITEVIDTTKAKGVVYEELPQSIVDSGTSYFEWSIFSGKVKSYPIAGCFFRNRFCFLADIDNVPTVFCSNLDDYENFSDKEYGEVVATNSITIPLTNGSYNKACWIYGEDVLLVGTSSAEFSIDNASSSQAFAPDNFKCQCFSNIGSLPITPIKVGKQVLFIAKDGREIRDIMYSFETDAFEASIISLKGKHLLDSGIKKIAFQTSPDKILWIATENKLVGLTHSIEEKVYAFFRNDLSGIVEDMVVIPNSDNKLDELWVLIDRNNTKTIEWVDNNLMSFDEEDEISNSQYVKINSNYLDSSIKGTFEEKNNVELTALSENLLGVDFMIFHDGEDLEHATPTIEDNNIYTYMKIGDMLNINKIRDEIQLRWKHNNTSNFTLGIPDTLNGYSYEIAFGGKVKKRSVISGNEITYTGSISRETISLYIWRDLLDKRIVNGLSHLEGMEVVVFADGAEIDKQVVKDGSIFVDYKYRNITVGLPIESIYIPQNMYVQGNGGAGVGDVQRIDHITLMLWRTMGGKIGDSFDRLHDIYFRQTDDVMGKSSPLYTGNKEIPVEFRTTTIKEKGATIILYNNSAYPMNILAIAPHFMTSGNGK